MEDLKVAGETEPNQSASIPMICKTSTDEMNVYTLRKKPSKKIFSERQSVRDFNREGKDCKSVKSCNCIAVEKSVNNQKQVLSPNVSRFQCD